ncbi:MULTISPECIES: DUF3383 family protein [unclassified Shinella]|uniref:DUF3383 family protein n=1 Tax=unclassified Shinella TaxID=2643062 RepID=UPI00234E6AFE|nr:MULTISPECIES: DUF3383 family protein [unclassified Shinella]MCO5152583.1 DUF3383 domain-containing protein [Shinella sp.]MDC7261878.1 DUF3383 domain-containing protein [Shinella sp. HY16]MDC7268773.1 DUF3383 domain-containing protein [Shinella sp. YZ44]
MAKVPYSRVVNVTMTRNDNFPHRRGFGTPIILTKATVSGQVDAANRTKLYASQDEVAADWGPTTDVYKAMLRAFARRPSPLQVKVGHVAMDETPTAAELQAQLDLVYEADTDWYFVTIDAALRDSTALDGLITWTETKNKLALIDSNAIGMQSAADTTNIAARHKGTVERTGVFYHPDANEFPSISLASYMATRDFDTPDSAYTAKFKNLPLTSAANLTSSKITAITGFTPGLGQAEENGHLANTYIDIGGNNLTVEGSTLTQNVFLDEIHATDWIVARTEEEALAIKLINARVPFTDAGMETIASAARTVMQIAARAGLIAQDLNPLTGEYEAAVEITVPSVFSVTEAQRKSRIAPPVVVRFRYAGAVHYTTINYFMTF